MINNERKLINRALFLLLLLFVVVNNCVFYPINILSWDVFGYYLYLPLTFIYHDIGVSNYARIEEIVNQYDNTATIYQLMVGWTGNYILKYSMGMAIMYLPFFLVGHLVALFSSFPADGFSLPYQYAIFIGSIFYSLLGLIFLNKVLQRLTSAKNTLIVLYLLVFGTNYLIHVSMYGQNAMSHSWLFTNYSIIIWLTIQWHEKQNWKYSLLLALFCGLTILSRPSEIICLLIPVLYSVYNIETLKSKIRLLFSNFKQLIVFGIILFIIGLPQIIYWKVFAGEFLYNSYIGNPGEGFDFKSPHTFNFLFSFRKGWLVYTPIIVFAIIGMIFLKKHYPKWFLPVTIFTLINVYIVSSWSCWWYAQSFSQRAVIQSYPLLCIAGVAMLKTLYEQRTIKHTVSFFTLVLLLINLFQSLQYHKGIISPDRMTKDYYLSVFGKREVDSQLESLLLINRTIDRGMGIIDTSKYFAKQIYFNGFEDYYHMSDSRLSYEGRFSMKLDTTSRYIPAFEIPFQHLTKNDHCWVRIECMIYPGENLEKIQLGAVMHFIHDDKPYHYVNIPYDGKLLRSGEWNKISFDYLTPEVRSVNNPMKVYLWNMGNETVHADNFRVWTYNLRN
jgi:hypothetical protein